jgi:hypothetical protein
MCVVELLLVGAGRCDPNYVRLIEAVSYSSTYVSLVYGADSINGNIYFNLIFFPQMNQNLVQELTLTLLNINNFHLVFWIRRDSNPKPLERELSLLTTRHVYTYHLHMQGKGETWGQFDQHSTGTDKVGHSFVGETEQHRRMTTGAFG